MSLTTKEYLINKFNINEKIIDLFEESELAINEHIQNVNQISQINQCKVLYAMQKNRLSDSHFHGTTGYGYDDSGREVIDKIYADIFATTDALVRHNFISGTHALSTALFGLLRPNDTLLSVTGKPYDTLEEVIGIKKVENNGSLKDFGVNYKQIDFINDLEINYDELEKQLDKSVKVAIIQRSRGYSIRPSLTISEIEKLIKFIKNINKDIICLVDNCYGEFVETLEPSQIGADICVGSLIKNPGGGIAQTGGYIVGKKEYVEKISYRLTCPGIGKECGATLGFNRNIIQGLFLAPHIVAESLKGSILASKVFEKLGFEVSPKFDQKRSDIIQSITFNDPKILIAFCQGIQQAAPVDSFAVPEPWDMPGYQHQVIMAAGTFIQGASIELSADAPIKPPYVCYLQGGMIYDYIKTAMMIAIQRLLNSNLITL